MSDERLLSEDEVALVFRRAAELEAEAPGDRAEFDVATLERIAAEAGLSPAAVRQAIAELHTGRLVPAPPEGRPRRRLATAPAVPSTVVVERRISAPPDVVRHRLDSYLKLQMFRVCRRRGDLTIWEPSRSLAANVMRGIDLVDRIRLRRVDGLEVQVTPDGDHGRRAHVRIVLDVSRVHRNARSGTLAGGALGASGVVAGIAGLAVGLPELALVVPFTTGAATAAHFGSRSTYAKHVKRAVDAIELVLDELER